MEFGDGTKVDTLDALAMMIGYLFIGGCVLIAIFQVISGFLPKKKDTHSDTH